MDSDSSEYEKKNYCVYLLQSQNPKFFGKIYIGFTVDPNRRLKQHNNGWTQGGAFKTNGKGPWEMILVVHGFPHEILALKFEWAWQNPLIARRVKHVPVKKLSESVLQYHLRILDNMTQIGPWKRLPIKVQWLKEANMNKMDRTSYLYSISYSSEVSGKYSLKFIHNHEDLNLLSSSLNLCFYCLEQICSSKRLVCPNTICNKNYHIDCLAKCLLGEENEVLPVKGHCPSCYKELLWCDLIETINDFIL